MKTENTDTKTGTAGFPLEAIVMPLLPCPCGKIPKELYIRKSPDGYKWAFLTPTCCDEWSIEFRTGGHDTDSSQCMELAVEEWNRAPRKNWLEKDAIRYRYMRQNSAFMSRNGPGLYWYLPREGRGLTKAEQLDKSIDDQLRIDR